MLGSGTYIVDIWITTLIAPQAAIKDGRNYQRFGTFTVTVEDAKEYLYAFSTRCVYKFQDIKINLYL